MERKVAGVGFLIAALVVIGARAAPGATYDQRQEGKVNVQIDVKDVQIVALMDSDMLEDYTNYDYAYDYADFTIKPRPTQSSKPTTSSSSSSSTTAETWSTWPTKPSADSSSSSSSSSSSTTASPQKDELSSTASPAIVSSSNSSTISTIGNSTILIIPLANGTASADSIKIGSNDTDIEKQNKPETSTAIVVEISTDAPKEVNDAGSKSASSDLGSTPSDEDIKIDEQNKRPPAMPEPRKRCPAGFLLKSGRCFKRRLSLIS